MMKYVRQFARQRKTIVVLSFLLGGVILLSFCPGMETGRAGAESEGARELATAGPSMTAMSVKLIGSVALIVGLLYLGMYAVKRFGPGLKSGGIKQDAISIMHKRHIAPKKAVYILKIGRRSMVVGVTDSQINHLADLTEEDVESIKSEEAPAGGSFKHYLFGSGPGSGSRS
jgi:flagellar biosynthetic protein FliO